jgi:hypothetical protein
MMDNLWPKAAAAAFGLLAVLAGWGLKEVYNVKMNVVRIETKLDVWMTPIPARPNATLRFASSPMRPEQNAEFATKALILAGDQVLRGDCKQALETILVGLQTVGLRCAPVGDHLECK